MDLLVPDGPDSGGRYAPENASEWSFVRWWLEVTLALVGVAAISAWRVLSLSVRAVVAWIDGTP
jgi:hypothetical protein